MNSTSVDTLDELLTPEEIESARRRGIAEEELAWQYETLLNPPAALVLQRPATVGDGIVQLAGDDEERLSAVGAEAARRGDVTRFVPASGAATRMFADLAAALDDPTQLESPAVSTFFERLDEFAFAEELRRETPIGPAHVEDPELRLRAIATLLRRTGLGYGALPKGLVPFHRYGTETRTAVGEHLREAALHAADDRASIRMHFTVADGTQERFEEEIRSQAAVAGLTIEPRLSIQDPSTDTLAIDPHGAFFRDDDGRLVWRPGGHGALLRNLALVRTPYASIKNIDNVRREEDHPENARWKRILIGLLDETRAALRALSLRTDEDVRRAADWISATFGRRAAAGQDLRGFVQATLERPVRVCGVVRNEGEPGGAPFWIGDGSEEGESLQIVEASQVSADDTEQKAIFASSTHFNPVDIAACLVDLDGAAIDLQRFVDRSAVFVSRKWYGQLEVRVLERPGLWNGGMAGWNTVCVEVPSFTFTPVKTVFDLLRDGHRGR